MLGLKWNHASKRNPWVKPCRDREKWFMSASFECEWKLHYEANTTGRPNLWHWCGSELFPDSKSNRIDVDYISIRRRNMGSMFKRRRSDGLMKNNVMKEFPGKCITSPNTQVQVHGDGYVRPAYGYCDDINSSYLNFCPGLKTHFMYI